MEEEKDTEQHNDLSKEVSFADDALRRMSRDDTQLQRDLEELDFKNPTVMKARQSMADLKQAKTFTEGVQVTINSDRDNEAIFADNLDIA